MKLLLACAISALVAVPALAQSGSSSTSDSNSSSTAIGVVSAPTANAGAQIETGGITVAGPSLTIQSEGSDIPPSPIIPSAGASAPTPQLFGPTNPGTAAAGLPLAYAISQICGDAGISLATPRPDIRKGESGLTQVTWVPEAGYVAGLAPIQTVWPKLSAGTYRCLGTLQVSVSEKGAQSANYAVVLQDAARYVLRQLQADPSQRVYVVTIPAAIAAPNGIVTNGKGAGVSAGGSFLPSILSLIGINGGVSASEGVAFPVNRVGATFLVVQADPDGVPLSLERLGAHYARAPQEQPPGPDPSAKAAAGANSGSR